MDVDGESYEQFTSSLNSSTPHTNYSITPAVKYFKEILEADNTETITSKLLSDGLVPTFHRYLKEFREDQDLSMDLVRIFSLLAYGATEQSQMMVLLNEVCTIWRDIIPFVNEFFQGVHTTFLSIIENTAIENPLFEAITLGLANMVSYPTARDMIASQEVIKMYIDAIDSRVAPTSTRRKVMWILSNFVRGADVQLERTECILMRMLEFITIAPEEEDLVCMAEACYCLKYFSDAFPLALGQALMKDIPYLKALVSFIKVFQEQPEVHKIALDQRLLSTDDLARPALMIFEAIIAAEFPPLIDTLFSETEFLSKLYELITNFDDTQILARICRLISNITAGTADQIQKVMSYRDIMQIMVQHLKEGDIVIKNEIVWVFGNTFLNIPENKGDWVKVFIESGVIEALCAALELPQFETAVCWEAFGNILAAAEMLVDGELVLFNPVALLMAKCGILHLLESVEGGDAIKNGYFGERYQLFLTRQRGLKTKRAQF